MRRAVDDTEKREIIERLFTVWTTGNSRFLRLGQLIGNVYHSTDPGGVRLYYEEDYPLIMRLEQVYRELRKKDPVIPEVKNEQQAE